MFSIMNDEGQRLMAIDYFVRPNQPVFTDEVDEAMIFNSQSEAAELLAAHHSNPAFGNCHTHNERPNSLYW